VRLLLDSHVAVWWLLDIELGPTCRQAISSADNVFFSPVTPWELGIKRALGKLNLPADFSEELKRSGFTELPIISSHANMATSLPPHHRDPFDRMLIAQARAESLTLVSADDAIGLYDVAVLDARS
jgi:PIN domain nuclease of toxin-antitoxin system